MVDVGTLLSPQSLLEPRLDAITFVMLGLIGFLGLVVIRFSRVYLDGDPGLNRYLRWLAATLGSVVVLVLTNNLLVLALAWIATSLALHQLLTFYPDRPQALLAAHKKFLASRIADLCLLVAIGLIAVQVGSLSLDALYAAVEGIEVLPVSLQIAALLLVFSAALKCAQLPFHGWLIQVMEAPTPVSALLHAGVVNLGGFLMIRMAPLMIEAPLAQTALVAAGCTSAVLAALVMTTRVSIKVGLAWSTCAQMGLMLVQCGLGAYHLALLHLVAHSLYKAHAFLRTGSAVDAWRVQAEARPLSAPSLGQWLAAAPVSLVAVAAVARAFGLGPDKAPGTLVLVGVFGLALAPLLLTAVGGRGPRMVAVALGTLAMAAIYFGWHALFARFPLAAETGPMPVRLLLVVVSFGTLYVLQALLLARPQGRVARALYPQLFAGFYLDEAFMRWTSRLWPARRPGNAPMPAQEI